MKTAVYTTLIAGGFLCAGLMLCGYLLCGTLLELINTPADVFADSRLYLDILFVAGFGMGIDGVAWATFCARESAAFWRLPLCSEGSGR